MLRRAALSASLLLASACRDEEADPCLHMCEAAHDLYGACLEGWGADWTAAGFEDGDAFLESCETWAWQMRLLEEEALDRGEIAETGHVDRTCAARAEDLSAEDAACTAFTTLDWSARPWEQVEEPADQEVEGAAPPVAAGRATPR